ncbi:ATP-binding protein, partial [Alicyclobacillus sp.]|uniref:ATP-binding protein n=1 Tax=Alicyclobacillus sp. TaxID=61169 RepID=UPI0025C126CC
MARDTLTGRKWTGRRGAASGVPLLFLAAGGVWLFAARPLLSLWWSRQQLPEWGLHIADVIFLTAISLVTYAVTWQPDAARRELGDGRASDPTFAAMSASGLGLDSAIPFRAAVDSPAIRQVLDLIPDLIVFKFPDDRLFLMNRAARALLEIEGEAYEGQTFDALLARGGWTWLGEPAEHTDRAAWRTGRPTRSTTHLARGDREVVLDVTKTPVYKADGTPDYLIVLGRDITALQRVEERLRQSDKLVSAGELAAGLAHELRNPMTALKGFLRLLERRVCDHPEYFRIMQGELDRMDHIINEFLQLSKPHRLTPRETDLASVLADVASLLQTQAILHDVNLHTRLAADLPPILGDPGQLKQVFINLVKNAIEAMPTGGDVWLEAAASDGMVTAWVRDNGPGIAREVLAQLGQPFFTTKPYGTGLGLQVSRRIVEEHGGRMRIESEPGAGTRVAVSLPAAADG